MTALPPGFVLEQPKPEVPSTSRVWGDKEAEAAGLYAPMTPKQSSGDLPAGFVLEGSQASPAAQIDMRFGEFAEPDNASALQSGLRDRGVAMTRGPAAPPGVQVLVDFQNQGIAAGQRTTPNIRAQSANLISTDVYESDAGTVMYRDPATGQLVETDTNKHVVLRDPVDARLKVFARSENTDEGMLSAAGRLLGTGFAAGAVTRRPNLSATIAAKPLSAGDLAAQAGERLANIGSGGAVSIPRAVASDNMAVQRIGTTVSNIPVVGNPLVKAYDATVRGLGEKVADIASIYGSGSKMAAGEAASGGIVDWITKTSKNNANKLYEKVDELVDHEKLVPPRFTKQVINKLTSEEVKKLPRDKSLQTIIDVFQANNRGLKYDDIKKVRTFVGELIERGIVPEGMSQGTLKQLYSGLTQDLKNTVRVAGGPQAEAAFNRANRYYDLASERRASLLKIVGKEGDAPAEQVFDRIVAMASNSSRADINRLAQARKAMGAENWNELASGIIAQMGRAEDAAGNVVFSGQKFLAAYQDKLSPSGRALLFRSAGKESVAPYLDDIATISKRFRQLQRFANPSGTGQTVAGTVGLAGVWAEPLTAIGMAIGTSALARVLAAPVTAAPAAHWARKYELALRAPTPANVAQLTIASRNLANTISAEIGVNVSAQDFLRAIQGGMKPRADDEQPEPVGVID